MESTELHLRIISPSCTKFDASISMVVMPGTEGDFGILPNHMSMIASLKRGNVRIYQNGKLAQEIQINSGVASVSPNAVDILISE